MKIFYNNHVLSTATTISCYSENPTYPCSTGLTDTRLSRKYRTVNDSAEYVTFDLGSTGHSISDIFVLGHNLTSTATVTISAGTTSTYGGFSTTTTIAEDLWHTISTAQSFRYWKIDFVDGNNPDTYIEMSHVYMGTVLDMPFMERSQKVPLVTTADVSRSVSGQVYGTKNIQYRAATVAFPYITDTQKKSLESMFAEIDIVRPFLMYIWPLNPTVEPLIYGRLTNAPQWQKVAGYELTWSAELNFEECR